ncbi:MAG: SRPBCC family protein [Spirochaetota bacterium]
MAHYVEKRVKVNIPASKIWNVLKDFSSVERFAVTIKSSPIINDKPFGLGAKRLCTFQDGSSLVEEIIQFEEGEGYTMELSEYSFPLKNMHSEMKVKAVTNNTSELFMSTTFVAKGGPFGWLLGQFLMAPMMKGVFTKLLNGLAYHSETGNSVGEKLPDKKEWSKLVLG